MSETQTTQQALVLPVAKGEFTFSSMPIPSPAPGTVLVRNSAVALNLVEWKMQRTGFLSELMTFPTPLGSDFAGIVVSVGQGVTTLQKGDRVISQGNVNPERAAFQEYTIASAEYTAKVPASVSLDAAATLSMGLVTAATGLYNATTLGAGLRAPWEENGRGYYKGTSILIIGGASSVGCYAIQLAKLSGFAPIYTTASLKHTAYLISLGASHVLDRNQPLASVLPNPNEKFSIIYDAISEPDTQRATAALLAPEGTLVLVHAALADLDLTEGKKAKLVFGSVFHPANIAIGTGLFTNLEKYLEDGDITPNRIEVLVGGLKGIVGGLKRLEEGTVSGVKLVVRPGETVDIDC
ncbi:hypothetical protein HWV62_44137 [Athelia sp. TMB]|nr:hypothetical protein HWV62_44137 [Athelia sp. TMB]